MKIMTFATYRANNPMHGGQIRLAALHEMLRFDGCSVWHIAVHTGSEDDLSAQETSFPLVSSTQAYLRANGMRADTDACLIFDQNDNEYDRFKEAITNFKPDVLWLEQPWCWPLIKRWLGEEALDRPAVIYGSQNVEYRLIESAATELSVDDRVQLAKRVELLEGDLCSNADGIVAVSPADAQFFASFGRPVHLAQNGVWPQAEPGGLDYWTNVFRHSKYALFVGSAHPPNAEGFVAMLGSDLSFMAPDEQITVCGGVCWLIERDPLIRKNRGLVIPRLKLLHQQDRGGLASLFRLTSAVILPIVSGGGTNLKTAEALYSRKPIVATTRAFRGYEKYIDFPNVHIADDADSFRACIKKVLIENAPVRQLAEQQSLDLDDLLWSRTLSEVGRWVRNISGQAHAAASKQTALAQFSGTSGLFGRRVLVSQGQLLKPFLGDGWHEFEESGTWSKQRVATLRLRNPFDSQNLSVRIDIDVRADRNNSNALDVYTASKHHVSTICDHKHNRRSIVFRVGGTDFSSDDKLELYIQVQKLFKAHGKNGTDDPRMLGCRVTRIELSDRPGIIS